MFAFLGDPQRFINGPIAQAEQRRAAWAGTQGYIVRVRNYGLALFLLSTFVIAMLPFAVQTGDYVRGWEMAKMVGVTVLAVNLLVTLYAFVLAAHIIVHEERFGTWESLILSRVSAQQIVLEKWWSVVRQTQLLFLFAGILNSGAAMAYRQYAYFGSAVSCINHFGWASCYWTDDIRYHLGRVDQIIPPSFNLLGVMLGTILLIAFALLATGLVAAIGVLAGLLLQRTRFGGVLLGITFKIGLALFVVMVWSHLTPAENEIYQNIWNLSNPSGEYENTSYPIYVDYAVRQEWIDILQTVQLGVSPLADGGVLLAADMMRPYDTHLHLLYRITSAMFALGLYVILLWLCLRTAVACAIHRQASRPTSMTFEEYARLHGYTFYEKPKRDQLQESTSEI